MAETHQSAEVAHGLHPNWGTVVTIVIFLAVQTGESSVPGAGDLAPQILVLVRGVDGSWSRSAFSRVRLKILRRYPASSRLRDIPVPITPVPISPTTTSSLP